MLVSVCASMTAWHADAFSIQMDLMVLVGDSQEHETGKTSCIRPQAQCLISPEGSHPVVQPFGTL